MIAVMRRYKDQEQRVKKLERAQEDLEKNRDLVEESQIKELLVDCKAVLSLKQ